MNTEKTEIRFKPIPCQRKGSHIALSIYPPGTWFENRDYKVFVGGCGFGEARTLPKAKELLLRCAREQLEKYIAEGEAQAAFYRKQLAGLSALQLAREQKGKE